jgi:hypothetical protein
MRILKGNEIEVVDNIINLKNCNKICLKLAFSNLIAQFQLNFIATRAVSKPLLQACSFFTLPLFELLLHSRQFQKYSISNTDNLKLWHLSVSFNDIMPYVRKVTVHLGYVTYVLTNGTVRKLVDITSNTFFKCTATF